MHVGLCDIRKQIIINISDLPDIECFLKTDVLIKKRLFATQE